MNFELDQLDLTVMRRAVVYQFSHKEILCVKIISPAVMHAMRTDELPVVIPVIQGCGGVQRGVEGKPVGLQATGMP